MTSQADNWTLFYSSSTKNNEVNKKMAQIMDFNHQHVPHEDRFLNFKLNPGLSVLLVNGFHNLILLHQVYFLHENILHSESKLLGLSGGSAKADV
jgi:hypothetical protein